MCFGAEALLGSRASVRDLSARATDAEVLAKANRQIGGPVPTVVSASSRPAPRLGGHSSFPLLSGRAAAPPDTNMLECDYCGCQSPNHEEGWVNYPWEKDAEPNALGDLLFCPPCATAVFGPTTRRRRRAHVHLETAIPGQRRRVLASLDVLPRLGVDWVSRSSPRCRRGGGVVERLPQVGIPSGRSSSLSIWSAQKLMRFSSSLFCESVRRTGCVVPAAWNASTTSFIELRFRNPPNSASRDDEGITTIPRRSATRTSSIRRRSIGRPYDPERSASSLPKDQEIHAGVARRHLRCSNDIPAL